VRLGIIVLLLLAGSFSYAGQDHVTPDRSAATAGRDLKWALTVYGGTSVQPDLGHVLIFQVHRDHDTYLLVAALAREFWRYRDWFDFELEGQVGKHFDYMDQWEFNGLIVGRWNRFPWDDIIDTSIAVGEGMSYATETPKVELEDDENAGNWLNYLLFEFTFGLPDIPQWSLVYRIHHRSSAWGTVGAGGSNFMCVGVKYRL
jgi:hypothetical protein